MSQFYTYMVECADGSLYTGWTVDLKQRVAAHNGEIPGGSKYTRTRRPVSLHETNIFDIMEKLRVNSRVFQMWL